MFTNTLSLEHLIPSYVVSLLNFYTINSRETMPPSIVPPPIRTITAIGAKSSDMLPSIVRQTLRTSTKGPRESGDDDELDSDTLRVALGGKGPLPSQPYRWGKNTWPGGPAPSVPFSQTPR
jgi:hypothetical protein